MTTRLDPQVFDDAKAVANLMVCDPGWSRFYPQELPFALAVYDGVRSTRGSPHAGCGGIWGQAEAMLESGMPGLVDRCTKCGEERA